MPLKSGALTLTSDLLIIARPHWNTLQEKVLQTVESYHTQYPLRRGIPREELKSRLKLSTRAFQACINKLAVDHFLADYPAFIAKPEHEIRFDEKQQVKVQALRQRFEQNPFGPPSVKDLQQEAGEEILNALIELNELIAVSSDVIFRRKDYDLMTTQIKNELIQKERITLSEVRDLFSTSRKYAQALLEHLDAAGVTVRAGDIRILKGK